MSLPVSELADKNCYLFLWVTAPCVQDGLDVLKAWGFEFFTVAFTWIKGNTVNQSSLFWGMGNATRANPEYVLLGRKGKLTRLDKGVHSVLMTPVERHSQKPAEIRNRIERLYGDLPRVELFARQKTEGWDVFGNEVEDSIEMPTHISEALRTGHAQLDGVDIEVKLKGEEDGTFTSSRFRIR